MFLDDIEDAIKLKHDHLHHWIVGIILIIVGILMKVLGEKE